METALLIIVIAVLFSAFFSGMEIAYVSSNKLRLELEMQKSGKDFNILRKFLESPSRFLSAILVGNNIALVIFSIYMAALVGSLMALQPFELLQDGFVLFLIQTFTGTFIILVFAEFIPKLLFRINPDRLLSFFSRPFVLFYYLLYPLVWLVIVLAEGILRFLFRISLERDEPLYSRFDLFHMIEESRPINPDSDPDVDARIFKNAMEFSDIKVRECMVPRTEVVAMNIKEKPDAARKKFIDSGHSKIMVYKETIDQIVGFIHQIDLFKYPAKLSDIVRSTFNVTESMAAAELLRNFIDKRKSIAVVVDEFGGTAGIITVEDLIEEIFGEIEDEHDKDQLTEKKISAREFIFAGRLEVDYINEKYDLSLPEGDYETLGGLVLSIMEKIPEDGELFYIKNYEISIVKSSATMIKEVRVKLTDPE